MRDARDGIVRLDLPDGRSVPLCLSYEALDKYGHQWVIDQLKVVQKGKAGAQKALAELLELLTGGDLTAEAVMTAPVQAYPLGHCLKAVIESWELAQYGPDGRSGEDAPANPQNRRLTLWARLTRRP